MSHGRCWIPKAAVTLPRTPAAKARKAAQELADTMLEHLADSQGTLYDTTDDHQAPITRPRELHDNATPSGNAMAVTALLKLAGVH